jgi:nitrite reductase/ring-hydroxylating ferredoxin subunit
VRDWEHLPWLHRESFASIALEQQDASGWRAQIGLRGAAGAQIRLELVASDDRRYVSRTLAGPGAATEIWTRLAPIDARRHRHRGGVPRPRRRRRTRDALGAAYVALYTRLWDQDEAMMQRRSFLLDAPRARRAAREPVDLGPPPSSSAAAAARDVFGGRRWWSRALPGELLAYDALCPHALGPLDEAPPVDGRVECPWHGKAFDVRTGRACDPSSRCACLRRRECRSPAGARASCLAREDRSLRPARMHAPERSAASR